MISHQKQTGMNVHYTRKRLPMMHRHETVNGDQRLYNWVMGFKMFLKWGVHAKPIHKGTASRSDGDRVVAYQRPFGRRHS